MALKKQEKTQQQFYCDFTENYVQISDQVENQYLFASEFLIQGKSQIDISSQKVKHQRQRSNYALQCEKSQWTPTEEKELYQLHKIIGNKWSVIAKKIKGRTDNCVKNFFYNKLRKSLRYLNIKINLHYSHEFKPINMNTIYKLMEANDQRHKLQKSVIEKDIVDYRAILQALLMFQNKRYECAEQIILKECYQLAQNLIIFNKKYKRKLSKSYKQQDYIPVSQKAKSKQRLSSINFSEKKNQINQSRNSFVFSQKQEYKVDNPKITHNNDNNNNVTFQISSTQLQEDMLPELQLNKHLSRLSIQKQQKRFSFDWDEINDCQSSESHIFRSLSGLASEYLKNTQ